MGLNTWSLGQVIFHRKGRLIIWKTTNQSEVDLQLLPGDVTHLYTIIYIVTAHNYHWFMLARFGAIISLYTSPCLSKMWRL